MKFRLIERILNEESLKENELIESYKQLWSQFVQLIDRIDSEQYDLHHIYEKDKSLSNNQVNYLLLPKKIHQSISSLPDQAIQNYKELKERFPDHFETLTVHFELFTPDDCQKCIDLLKQSNNQAKKERSKEARKNKRSNK